ncbi:hypothetical protein CDAR_426961 [Caerostris darwini]|uniref:Uncharacterized protein n=1 Tax=Caerostris darwini TaxID=1538125 RepID=A0AAV4R533_9ARAC|nr:hypothetical protein CDAR_426961 [Caerostris darwini]
MPLGSKRIKYLALLHSDRPADAISKTGIQEKPCLISLIRSRNISSIPFLLFLSRSSYVLIQLLPLPRDSISSSGWSRVDSNSYPSQANKSILEYNSFAANLFRCQGSISFGHETSQKTSGLTQIFHAPRKYCRMFICELSTFLITGILLLSSCKTISDTCLNCRH